MSGLDWPKVKALPWRERNAAIEKAVRWFLGYQRPSTISRTETVAIYIAPGITGKELGRVAQILTRMAPRLGPLATHDGEVTRSGGRRWRWHGQRKD